MAVEEPGAVNQAAQLYPFARSLERTSHFLMRRVGIDSLEPQPGQLRARRPGRAQAARQDREAFVGWSLRILTVEVKG